MAEATLQKDWVPGSEFQDGFAKPRVMSAVVSELEQVADKQISKAQSILSAIVSDLVKAPTFCEVSMLTAS